MAKEEITSYVYTDDLTGEKVEEDELHTIEFSYGGNSYTIDLSTKNAMAFDKLIQPYLDKATPKVNSRSSAPKAKSNASRTGARAWAEEQGLVEKGGRGRLPKSVVEAFDAAH